jgi:hypothetical protein
MKEISYEHLQSLLESKKSCALHLQVALDFFCDLAYKMLEGAFPDEEICCLLVPTDLP